MANIQSNGQNGNQNGQGGLEVIVTGVIIVAGAGCAVCALVQMAAKAFGEWRRALKA